RTGTLTELRWSIHHPTARPITTVSQRRSRIVKRRRMVAFYSDTATERTIEITDDYAPKHRGANATLKFRGQSPRSRDLIQLGDVDQKYLFIMLDSSQAQTGRLPKIGAISRFPKRIGYNPRYALPPWLYDPRFALVDGRRGYSGRVVA